MESFLPSDFVESSSSLNAIAFSLSPSKVLVVDDEAETVEEITECLIGEGLAVGCADGALAAIEELRLDPYFMVVLTDLRMPEMGGLDFIRLIERTKMHARLVVQVVVLTGHATNEEIAFARREGAVCVLRKPCSLDDLVREVNAACGAARDVARRFQSSTRNEFT